MKTLLLFSGGMDSSYLLHKLTQQINNPSKKSSNVIKEVICLFFNYQQPHAKKELFAAKQIPKIYEAKLIIEELAFKFLVKDMKKSPVIFNRNMIFLALAGAIAKKNECGSIHIGCTKSDFETFSDCRPLFLREMNDAMLISIGIHVVAPLVGITKKEIVEKNNDVPWHLTWSCYAGNSEPCGDCLACKERIAASV